MLRAVHQTVISLNYCLWFDHHNYHAVSFIYFNYKVFSLHSHLPRGCRTIYLNVTFDWINNDSTRLYDVWSAAESLRTEWSRPPPRSRRCWATWEPLRCAWRGWCGLRTCEWSPSPSGRARAPWCRRLLWSRSGPRSEAGTANTHVHGWGHTFWYVI